jgi:Ni/Co efflux regulator RcnB
VRHEGHRVVHRAAKRRVRHEVHRAHAAAANSPFARVRKEVHAKRRLHAGQYRSPPGWFSHRWVLGERLPRPWFVRDYWIMDWQIYGLWAPIDGLIWVRVGNDALLIDPDSGEVVGIEYDVFW